MGYNLKVSEHIDKVFRKLSKKDKQALRVINKKVKKILEYPYHFKPLRGDMHGARRVHIMKSFVLTYEIDEKNKVVKLLDYDHHDKVYK